MIKVKILAVTMNGENVKIMPENSFLSQEEVDFFVHIDPIYVIEVPEKFKMGKNITVSIKGEIERLDDTCINEVVMKNMYDNREELYSYQEKIHLLEQKVIKQEAIVGEHLLTIDKQQELIKNYKNIENELNYYKEKIGFKVLARLCRKDRNSKLLKRN